jgi:hypothetical protein
MSSRLNPSEVDNNGNGGFRRHSQDLEMRRSRSTGTTPRSSTRKSSHRTLFYGAKDVVDSIRHVDNNSSTSSDEDDDRCRIIPANPHDDDYLERLDRKVSEVINRSRLVGNLPTTGGVDLTRSNSEHYGPLSLSYSSRHPHHHHPTSKKSSPGSAHRISSSRTTPRSSETTVVNSSSNALSTLHRPDAEGNVVRFGGDNNNDDDGDSSDTVESSPEDFVVGAGVGVGKSSKVERWSDVDDNLEDESAEGDDEDNDGYVIRRRR